MTNIDAGACAELVRTIAKEVLASAPRAGAATPLVETMGHIRAASDAAEARLRGELAARHPEIGWTGEEARPDRPDYWLYDPIDGAYHYAQGLPLWATSLVLVREGRPVLAIVYDATQDELFVAEAGKGATRNGERIRTASKSELAAAVVGTAVPPILQVGPAEQDEALAIIARVARKVFVVRPIAAASLQLAYVAAGRLDAYIENGNDAADWLAGALLVEEAGGKVTDLDNAKFGWEGHGILAAGPTVHAALVPVLAQA